MVRVQFDGPSAFAFVPRCRRGVQTLKGAAATGAFTRAKPGE